MGKRERERERGREREREREIIQMHNGKYQCHIAACCTYYRPTKFFQLLSKMSGQTFDNCCHLAKKKKKKKKKRKKLSCRRQFNSCQFIFFFFKSERLYDSGMSSSSHKRPLSKILPFCHFRGLRKGRERELRVYWSGVEFHKAGICLKGVVS